MNTTFLTGLLFLLNYSYCFKINYLTTEEIECPPWNGDVIYIPDPDDCSKYYQCTPSRPEPHQCSDGLFFDPKINVCNWPDLVECDGM